MSRTPNNRALSPSPGPKPKTLGLHVIHQPECPAILDIIFVHGLGGDSRKTWSKNHDPALFWPEQWLPHEQSIGKARISSFGYNADFRPGSSKSISNISDFAKELLYEMRFSQADDSKNLDIGTLPIIFVVHSMGGLVVKKAYLLGQNDSQYQDMVRSISAIVFLATPHRGTNLAEILNRVLTVSFQSPKNFINELNKNSSALEELNEQFRHIAPRLSIVSFYETLATPVGPTRLQVLEKDSSILGYPKEISRALNADHHDVCKYSDPEDPNYVSVRNALKSLVGRFRSKGAEVASSQTSAETNLVEKLLGSLPEPDEDFNSFRRWWIPGTCDWILCEPVIQAWLDESLESRVVWFNAPPASGKSILATQIINHFRDTNDLCQYYFFKFGDQTKRSPNAMLRSLASQIAKQVPVYRRNLLELSTGGLRLEKADSALIWQRLFESLLFKVETSRPLYWVIDALDEAESPRVLLDLLRTVATSRTTIRILIISRKTEPLVLAFDRLSGRLPVHLLEKGGHDFNSLDIRTLVDEDIKHMRGSDELKGQVASRVMTRASGNFLWVRLVLEEILGCHTEEAIQETLDEIPNDMNELYQRMELAIVSNSKKANKSLAKAIFQWTICAQRSLTLKELSEALRPEYPLFLDLGRTIRDVCGQFIQVNEADQVGMVHQTARDYLLQTSNDELCIKSKQTHANLFMKTVSTILNMNLAFKSTHSQHMLPHMEPFLFYAATSWTFHLKQFGTASDEALDMLIKLFESPIVLNWIYLLALLGRMEILVKAAKALTHFVSATRRMNAPRNPLLHRLSDLELLDKWIVDLPKVVGKFGNYLRSDPSAVYKLVPPFCPNSSILYQQFHNADSAIVSISGISNMTWNDNLARIALPQGSQAWKVACAGQHVAVLSSAGVIVVWNSYNFAKVCTLQHSEPVTAICFDSKGTQLMSCGLYNTILWSVPSGQPISSTTTPADSRAMSISFTENDTKIIVGSNDKAIRYLHTHDLSTGWHVSELALLREVSEIEGAVANSPMCMAFNGNATQVGVSYRGFPLSVWALDEARCIGRCKRVKDTADRRANSSTSWFAVDRFTWNPVSGHIIGIYRDGCLFKWHPVTDETQEVQSAADEVAASLDGKLFVTSNSNGTVRVWSFAYFSVIYQLSSSDLVTGLAFSPDARRFYDLRGSSINAWEPNSLIRFAETEESSSDAASEDHSSTLVSQASEAWLEQYEAVSSLAIAPKGDLYCVGNEEGAVDLVNSRTGETTEFARLLNFLSITHIVWSDDAEHVAAADLGGEIVLKSLMLQDHSNTEGTISLKSRLSPKFDLEGRGIHQILFSRDSSLLLVVTEDRGQVAGVTDATIRVSAKLENASARRWLLHPTQDYSILAFGTDDVKILRWDDLSVQCCLVYHEGRPRFDSHTSFYAGDDQALSLTPLTINREGVYHTKASVDKAMLTQDGKHVLVEIHNSSSQEGMTTRLLIFDNAAFELDPEGKSVRTLTYLYISPSITSKVELALGILAGSKLVFLDQDLWVCTFKVGAKYNEEAPKRHYFIPRDWSSTEGLALCSMMGDGTLLCPKHDQVAVIKSSLEVNDF